MKPKVESMLSSAEMVEFKQYLSNCLSCDYDTMTEEELQTAYSSYVESIQPEEECNQI